MKHLKFIKITLIRMLTGIILLILSKLTLNLLAYNKEGLTELVLKKLTFGFKRVGNDGDLILSFIDIDKDPAIEGQALFYMASRYGNSPFLTSQIKFFI